MCAPEVGALARLGLLLEALPDYGVALAQQLVVVDVDLLFLDLLSQLLVLEDHVREAVFEVHHVVLHVLAVLLRLLDDVLGVLDLVLERAHLLRRLLHLLLKLENLAVLNDVLLVALRELLLELLQLVPERLVDLAECLVLVLLLADQLVHLFDPPLVVLLALVEHLVQVAVLLVLDYLLHWLGNWLFSL